MHESINSVEVAAVFSTLDVNSGYWHIRVEVSAMQKTDFVSHHSLYRFARTSSGLEGASETFQRTMYVILSSVKWQRSLVYLNDVAVFSKTLSTYIEYVLLVLPISRDTGVPPKRKNKNSLQVPEIVWDKLLGHDV